MSCWFFPSPCGALHSSAPKQIWGLKPHSSNSGDDLKCSASEAGLVDALGYAVTLGTYQNMTLFFWQNSHFGPSTIIRGTVSSLNFQNGRFSPQTILLGLISS